MIIDYRQRKQHKAGGRKLVGEGGGVALCSCVVKPSVLGETVPITKESSLHFHSFFVLSPWYTLGYLDSLLLLLPLFLLSPHFFLQDRCLHCLVEQINAILFHSQDFPRGYCYRIP